MVILTSMCIRSTTSLVDFGSRRLFLYLIGKVLSKQAFVLFSLRSFGGDIFSAVIWFSISRCVTVCAADACRCFNVCQI